MQTSVETTGNLERRVTFQLPAEQVEGEVGGRLREIARTARIKGFRPGKVPTKVIEQRYGPQVRAEVLDGLLRQGFDQVVRGNDLRIAGSPTIEPTEANESGLAYVATFEVVPEFGDIDVATLDVIRHTAEVSEDDIDRMIENLRQQRRSWTVVEREAREGDAVEAQSWSMVDGARVPADGHERLLTMLGSNSVLPQLEQALAGMRAGEEKTVDVEFPVDWRVPQLAGKTAQAHLRLERVSESALPEADVAFIRSFGVKNGELEQFRADIRSNLERELKGALMGRLRREVSEKLAAAYEHVEMPPRLVQNEARTLAQQSAEQVRRQGGNPQMPENAHEAFLDGARKRVLVGLLVGEIARRNELRLDMGRVNETLRLIASTYEEPQQVIEMYRDDPQLMGSLQSRVMEEQVIDWIAERARHRDEALSFQEAISPSA